MSLRSRIHTAVAGTAVLLSAGGAVLLAAPGANAATGITMSVAITQQSTAGSACNWTVTFNATLTTASVVGPHPTITSVSVGSYGTLATSGGLTVGTVLKPGTNTFTGLSADGGTSEGSACPTEAPDPLVLTVGTSDGPLTWNQSVSDPQVVTMMALPQGNTGATLAGSFDVANCTQYYFQYGRATTYGQQSTVYTANCPNGGTTTELASFNATGLQSGSTYHYRLVVAESNGTKLYGQDVQFQTGGIALPVGTVGLIGMAVLAGGALLITQRRRRHGTSA